MAAFAEEKESAPSRPPRISREDYLIWESQQETKHEYHAGFVIEMSGASPEHVQIASNLNGEIYLCVRGTACRFLGSDMRCFVPQCDKYYYPDGVVVCGLPEYEDIRGVRSLLNPTLAIEILSPTSERSDRTDKFDCYKTLASLQTYVLIAQDSPLVQVFDRQTADKWIETIYGGLDATANFDRIGCELSLADIYALVEFAETQNV